MSRLPAFQRLGPPLPLSPEPGFRSASPPRRCYEAERAAFGDQRRINTTMVSTIQMSGRARTTLAGSFPISSIPDTWRSGGTPA